MQIPPFIETAPTYLPKNKREKFSSWEVYAQKILETHRTKNNDFKSKNIRTLIIFIASWI